MGLGKYFSKRHFGKTPEPKGAPKVKKSKKLVFVVQEHHASRLHYDFRLELDGVLKSWAVPKGPSMNPRDRHLAVHVEDHPYEYRTFEGVIPEGNYGAGTVIVWDEGTYEPRVETDTPQETLLKELDDGHLTFVLHGKKLHGEFALIRMPHATEKNAWLLIKKDDAFASTSDITTQDSSVKTGKKVDELEGATGHLSVDLAMYPKVSSPWKVSPMLCTLIDEPFSKEGWLFEVKWDGYRAIGGKHKDEITLYSRTGKDFSQAYAPIAEALRTLAEDVILDGEIVVVDEKGAPHFEWLQSWRSAPKGELHYYVFDILWYNGHDIRTMPLWRRKKLLQSLIPKQGMLRYSDHIETKGEALFHEMQKKGLEGVVAKKAESSYRENNRGEAWLKIKTHLRQEVVIGGYTEPRGSRQYLGSLIVGVYEGDTFVYVGHSGGGIPDEQRKQLLNKLQKLERKTSPFAIEPKPNAPVHWVKPELVCEMSFSEWTEANSMRHPSFEGLRPDKKPQTVHREKAKPIKAVRPKKVVPALADSPLELTHLDKVFFPEAGYTKGDILAYYESVASYILPYLKDRPLSLYRQPNGITGESFFQKNIEHLPSWLTGIDIFSESNSKNLHWLVGGSIESLRYIVQLGSIEVNPWNSRIQHLDKPDWLVIDLDPEGVTFEDVITVAQEVKRVCDDWKIPAFPKTSGKTGIHIYVPLGARYHFDQAKDFAHLLALEIHKRQPELTSVERLPKKRPHKIYLDFLQNREGQTLAAPYSLRPTPAASISTPLHWDEVKKGLRPTDFTLKTMPHRLESVGDLWTPVLGKGIPMKAILDTLPHP